MSTLTTSPAPATTSIPASTTTAVTFAAIGTTNTIVVTEPETMDAAVAIARRHLAELDRAVSRSAPTRR